MKSLKYHFQMQKNKFEINVDEFISENIEAPNFGRIGAMAAKQVVVKKLGKLKKIKF